MRRFLLLALVVACTIGLVACDTVTTTPPLDHIAAPDDSALPDSVKTAYEEDAAQLAMRYVQRRGTAADSIRLPEDRVELFYNALVHVYTANDISERDDIVEIHTFPRYNTHEAIVAMDTTVAWTEAWLNGERLTGQPDVDALLEDYELSVEHKPNASQPYVLVRSAAPINTLALSRQFEGIEGVAYAEQNGYAGDGNDIEATVEEDAVVLAFRRAWGDCPSGCINEEAWVFSVDAAGTVRFERHEEE